jgi:hypothetical protein
MKSGLIIEVTFGGSGLIRGVIVFIMMAMLSKVQLYCGGHFFYGGKRGTPGKTPAFRQAPTNFIT